MICGITLNSFRDKLFFQMLPNIDPKPDVWIMINEFQYIPFEYKRLDNISNNYNNACSLIPDETEYALVLEDDCEVPNNILQILKEDIEYLNCDVVTTAVYNRIDGELMVWTLKYENDKPIKVNFSTNKTGLKKLDLSSLNCFIIKTDVLKNVPFYPANHDLTLYTDTFFFSNVKRNGYTVYCDFDIETIHDGNQWPGIKSIGIGS